MLKVKINLFFSPSLSLVACVQQEQEEEAVEEEKEKQSGWKDGRREGWKQFEEVVRSG